MIRDELKSSRSALSLCRSPPFLAFQLVDAVSFLLLALPLMSAPTVSSMQAYVFSAPKQVALKQVDKPKVHNGAHRERSEHTPGSKAHPCASMSVVWCCPAFACASSQLSAPLDVLVRVHAVATNPVDSKALLKDPTPRTVGYDASGVIEEVGSEAAAKFKVGQEVFYAGQLTRAGSFAEWQLVDSRFIAVKPKSLSHADAAAFPLVSLTASEALSETMRIDSAPAGRSILILPGAGGVGSVAIQLAKAAGLHVIATASRDDTKAWATKMGADVVVDHTKPFLAQWNALGLAPVHYILSTHNDEDLARFPDIIAPRGHIVSINGNADIGKGTVAAFFVKVRNTAGRRGSSGASPPVIAW